jgi:uncharacterized protein
MTQRALDDQLVEMLRCPVTLSKLTREGDFLVSEVGGMRYPVRDGFPVMLPEEATLPEGIATLEEFKKRFGRR